MKIKGVVIQIHDLIQLLLLRSVVYIFKFFFRKSLYGIKCDIMTGKQHCVISEVLTFIFRHTPDAARKRGWKEKNIRLELTILSFILITETERSFQMIFDLILKW